MSERISWSLNVDVAGGPKKAFSRTIEVDAYDKISVDIPAATMAGGTTTPGTMDVEVQPADETSRLRFLLITAARYAAEEEVLTVACAGVPSGIALDGPLLLFSQGAVGLLGEAPPQSLTFSSNLDSPLKVDILVGRNVHEEG